jgi:hypothetical protein
MAAEEIARRQALTTGELNLLQQNAALCRCNQDTLIGNCNDPSRRSSDFLVSSRAVHLESRSGAPQGN